ncbi:hypothetical protein [Bibersteinia trehalosi]|uniref:hypothetical protein n=1 Tax=Bibersteinia trehalosi TaxID=47735 RepID=UPI002D77F56D|nr:hypothetical protein [Bibersteinia trehalosi]
MWQSLLAIYLKPEHWGYRLLENSRCYWLYLSLIGLAILLTYPLFITSQAFYQQQHWQTLQNEKQQYLAQQTKLLEGLQQIHQQDNQKDNQIAAINQQIKNLASQQQATIETLQWRFSHGKQIELVLQQKSQTIFPFIEQMTVIKQLHFKQLSLLKLNQKKQVQLSAEITVK